MVSAPGWPSAEDIINIAAIIHIVLIYLGSFLLGLLFKLVQYHREQLQRQDDATATSDVTTGTGHEDKNRKRSTNTRGDQRVQRFIQYVLGFYSLLIFCTGIVSYDLCFFVVAGFVLGMFINMYRRRREKQREHVQ